MTASASPRVAGCALCRPAVDAVWRDAEWRIVRVVDEPDFPAFYRVVAEPHVVEFSDLGGAARARCMALVCVVETVLRRELAPTKVNLAALGNAVPHLHWHVVARFDWDSRFPLPIWAPRQRDVAPDAAVRMGFDAARLDAAVAAAAAEAGRPAPAV